MYTHAIYYADVDTSLVWEEKGRESVYAVNTPWYEKGYFSYIAAHANDKKIVYTKKEKVWPLWYRRVHFDIHLFKILMQNQNCDYVAMMVYV